MVVLPNAGRPVFFLEVRGKFLAANGIDFLISGIVRIAIPMICLHIYFLKKLGQVHVFFFQIELMDSFPLLFDVDPASLG